MAWITRTEYVDLHTGEILTKKQVDEKYIVIKTLKSNKYESGYSKNRWVRTLTKLCTTNGKQSTLFGSERSAR